MGVSVAIWSRGEGTPEVAHRPARREGLGHVLAGSLQDELPLGQAADRVADRADVDRARRRAHALEQPGLVPLGLQAADHPRPGVGDGLVVEVDGVLGGQHHADAEGPRLLHQGHDRLLGRRVGGGRHVARDLVHVDEGPQVGGPALLAHPRDDLGEQERGHELPLVLGEVRDRDDRGARLAVGRPQQRGDVERGPLGPRRERRGRQQAVEPKREGLPVGRGEEGVQVEHAELAQGRLQHLADERREVEAASLAPRGLDEVGQEDELARGEGIGGDAHQAEQAGDEALDLVADGLDVARVGGRLERADQVHRHTGRGARRVDREAHTVVDGLEALGPDAPAGQALPPGRGLLLGELVRGDAGLLGVALVDPGAEVGGRQLGEQQEQVGQIALGVDEQAGHARREALLDQHDAETGLARTGHAHDHAVRGEVAAREGDGGVRALVGGRVDHGAEGQVCHPGNVGPGQAGTGGRGRRVSRSAERRRAGGGHRGGDGREAQSPRQPGERVLQCRGPEREVVPARAEQHAGLAEARCGDLGESLGGGRRLRRRRCPPRTIPRSWGTWSLPSGWPGRGLAGPRCSRRTGPGGCRRGCRARVTGSRRSRRRWGTPWGCATRRAARTSRRPTARRSPGTPPRRTPRTDCGGRPERPSPRRSRPCPGARPRTRCRRRSSRWCRSWRGSVPSRRWPRRRRRRSRRRRRPASSPRSGWARREPGPAPATPGEGRRTRPAGGRRRRRGPRTPIRCQVWPPPRSRRWRGGGRWPAPCRAGCRAGRGRSGSGPPGRAATPGSGSTGSAR